VIDSSHTPASLLEVVGSCPWTR